MPLKNEQLTGTYLKDFGNEDGHLVLTSTLNRYSEAIVVWLAYLNDPLLAGYWLRDVTGASFPIWTLQVEVVEVRECDKEQVALECEASLVPCTPHQHLRVTHLLSHTYSDVTSPAEDSGMHFNCMHFNCQL